MALITYSSFSSQETKDIGRVIAKDFQEIQKGILCLTGEIGAGKTTLIKGFVSELLGISEHCVHSPTFNYLNIYEGTGEVYHFDCYRLKNGLDFLGRGFDEYFTGICLVEWPEKIEDILPQNRGLITMTSPKENERIVVYETC